MGPSVPKGAEVGRVEEEDVGLPVERNLDDVARTGDYGVVEETHRHFLPAPFFVGSTSV